MYIYTYIFIYTFLGTFPCKFDENFAKLKNGANHFELEMYSTIDNKRYMTQKIPDIHHFNQYIHDEYYNGNVEKKKFFLTSLLIVMANFMYRNPKIILKNLKYLSKFIGPQLLLFINFIEKFSKDYILVLFKSGRFFSENLNFLGGFLFRIYRAGLVSPMGKYIYVCMCIHMNL
jgi:hypothetical protein